MKTKHIKYSIAILAIMQLMVSCKKDFLELTPKGTATEENFYRNETEVYQGLVAVYDVMQWGTSGGYTMKQPLLSAASDDCWAGGGNASDQPGWVAYDNFNMDSRLGPQVGLWSKNFTGINRANIILDKIEKATNLSAGFKSRITAEAKFLRAYFYFDLVRFFGNVPLITKQIPTADLYTQTQSAPTAIYAQIEKDLREAFPSLPPTVAANEKGRISRGTAKALLGKVLLFQNDNSKLAEAATLFNDVNKTGNEYGYALLPNYADIFRPDNKFNSEVILEIPHSTLSAWGDWGWVNGGEGNVAPQFIGMDSYNGDTYSAGWGFCPVTLDLVNAMKADPRFATSIIDGAALKAAGATYTARYQNTNYFIKKYAPLKAYRSNSGVAELNWPIDEIEMRLADTYLMEAEALVRSGGNATRALELLTAVRARVGLAPVPATLDNIYNERRLELAFEGHRFFDLVRTNRAVAVLGPLGFKAGKSELLPVPQQEIDLTKGVIKQNPGYN
ncbi:RagB/SusD family nutrient uptake outer membrane protein [Pedobacter sp. MC2016-05]|uniref:RagB/SusD family nutrient uptake outer membrane protein n=1 Tax=Pedobacter sp. MC2016-05 TaxID=2994474 RepID=UPI002246E53D|nr:RagB/SusD family nutrient uptake outer membrane protein [Pedobacter sp. MC2016-05]MCX2474241.1 RagB/SusD family nutrient uptake outer membrane protein [Pedobacter sp. MC2016-05]